MKGGKGPNIAVMLGVPKGGESSDDDYGAGDGEMSLADTKARAEDAAVAFAAAVGAKDAKRIVKAFCSMQTLCGKLEELEESGETADEEAAESPAEETEESSED